VAILPPAILADDLRDGRLARVLSTRRLVRAA
jgi:hypothetical protein